MLEGKKILLGVTGGIAAYKSAELARLLVKKGGAVQVIMTRSACEFITPLTLRTITGLPVRCELFEEARASSAIHIELARTPDVVLIAPATANILAKMAVGMADDLLSTVLLAVDMERIPVILAPAMNVSMLQNPAVRDNLEILGRRGFTVAEPGEGGLACGEVGQGRMVEPGELVRLVEEKLAGRNDFAGQTVLVTAGPTREPLDPVRFISNHSTGTMGYALARAARERGARVVLISGPTFLDPPGGVDFVSVSTARQMYDAVMARVDEADIVIKAAAVSDYRPEKDLEHKLKKGGDLELKMVRNPDILKEIGAMKGKRFLVGFAAETEELLANASKKMAEKNLDLIVANDLSREGAGFGLETNIAQLLYKSGEMEEISLMSKYRMAHCLLDRIKACREGEGW